MTRTNRPVSAFLTLLAAASLSLLGSACSDVIVNEMGDGVADAGGDTPTGADQGPVASPLPDDPVAYYAFDGDDEDLSGHEYDLDFVYNGTFVADRWGFAERAYDFKDSGSGIYYATSVAPGLSVWPDVSMAVWIKGGSGGNERRVMGQDDWMQLTFASGGRMQFGMDDDDLGETWAIDEGGDSTSSWTFFVGTAARIDDGEGAMRLRLYRDGELVAEEDTAPMPDNAPSGCLFFVGPQPNLGKRDCRTPDAAPKLSASIDDVRVFRRALSAGEVRALYHEGGWEGR